MAIATLIYVQYSGDVSLHNGIFDGVLARGSNEHKILFKITLKKD